ncbi:MAG: hypothetical protein QG632_282 [Candidatus Dependentiae bacterium]|nr:hypothetical protein [Candidatus Dependentiae bacterium]
MLLRKGFLLLEAALYGAIVMMALGFFIAALHTYISWQQRVSADLTTLLYHYRALAVIEKDLSCASAVVAHDNQITIHITKLDAHWGAVAQTVTYVCRKNGLYRQKITAGTDLKTRKSGLRLAPTPLFLRCVLCGTGYTVTYGVRNHAPLTLHVNLLSTKGAA